MKIFTWISKMCSEDNGNPSAMRFLALLSTCVFLFNWTYASVQMKTVAIVDWTGLMLLLGPIFAKICQKPFESK